MAATSGRRNEPGPKVWTQGGIKWRDVRGVPIAVERCEAHGSNKQRCIRHVGHNGRHVTMGEFRR